MEYLKIEFDETEFWVELETDKLEKYVTRQIIIDHEGVHLSCFEDCMAEGAIDISELDGKISEIKNCDFEKKWLENTKSFLRKWENIKKSNPLGSIFKGKIQYFYPQGVVVKNKYATAIIKENIANIYPGLTVQCQVIGYDNVNLWLIATLIT